MKVQNFSVREGALLVDALLHKANDDRALSHRIRAAGLSTCTRCSECGSAPAPCATCQLRGGMPAIANHADDLERQAKEMESLADTLDQS